MSADIELWQAAVSLILIVVVLGVSFWRGLGLERSIVWATLRATVQLLAVGVFFAAIFESSLADLWSWLWVLVMVSVSAYVVTRRARSVPLLAPIAFAAIGVTCAVVLAVLFGGQVFDLDPVVVVVIAGITIGNTMPAVVQAVDRCRSKLIEDSGQIEAMLALGFDAVASTRPLARDVTRLALVPQIEKTRVVGLIALPGAVTGLLLAGADPLDAVLVQLVVMFLVLGSMAVAVTVVTLGITRQALTDDLRLADWVHDAARA
ncbi:MAG: ABC transporter permease [Actinomycetota bacterium]